jgi:hypothetical protein
MKPSTFEADVEGRPRNVRLLFGDEGSLAEIHRWRCPKTLRDNPHVGDALEYARLASKRWRYYRRNAETATSLASLQAAIRRNPKAEVAFMLIASADWRPRQPILGLAYCRRTWCHRIIVDFVAVHPHVVGRLHQRIRGVGTGLFHGLIQLADALEIETIWGEATANSAPFYQKILGAESIRDQFVMAGETLAHCRRQLDRLHSSQA